MPQDQAPKLRSIDPHAIVHGGRPSILLRDPLQLSERTVVIPQQLAPLLMLCDGTRDANALRASLAVRFGLRVGQDMLERILSAFDKALLLENERFLQAREQALDAYRQAPYRSPILAGQSYPANPDDLRRVLQSYVDAAEAPAGEIDGRGLITPHIDYERGGAVYAEVWKRAEAMIKAAELVILLGTDHFGEDGRLTLTRQQYATPFGVLPTAQDAVDELAQAMGPETAFADELRHRSEHSIELAAVWLHFIREGEPCELLPILCGSFGHFIRGEASLAQDASIRAMVDTLRPRMSERPTIVVAAADLGHVGPAFGGQPQRWRERAQLQDADDELIDQIRVGSAGEFYQAIERKGDRYNVCGLPPIYLALRLTSPIEGELVAYDQCPADQKGTSLVSICGAVLLDQDRG